jgi:pimeloyl-ACP methyl ester carboxylesterase
MTSRFVDIGGLRTHYLEAGAGPLLVLVHGGGAGADARGNWLGCMPHYAGAFRVVAVDMVGFGASAKPAPADYEYTQANRVRHLVRFIEHMGAPALLIGNSMGGATALGVAIERPELVRKLVLMGSAGVAVHNPDPEVRKSLSDYDFTLEGMRRLVRTLTGPDFVADDALIRYRYELTLAPDARAALEAMRAATAREGLAYPDDAVRGVATPTLVVGGKDDRIAVLARTYRFLELLPNSWGFVLPHCGHWVMLERPLEFVAVTRAFLTSEHFGSR